MGRPRRFSSDVEAPAARYAKAIREDPPAMPMLSRRLKHSLPALVGALVTLGCLQLTPAPPPTVTAQSPAPTVAAPRPEPTTGPTQADTPAVAALDSGVYADALAAGWENWSWDTGINLAASAPVHAGSHAAAVTFQQAWAGFYLHAGAALDGGQFTALRFYLHGGAGGGQQISVAVNGDTAHAVTVNAPAGAWQLVELTLAQLGSPASLNEVWWQDASNGAQATFYLDDIVFVGSAAPPAALALSVNVGAGRHAISPLIYGLNFADETFAAELDLPLNRWGGNSTTRYNWQNDTYNTASDWFFQNIPNTNADVAALPDGSASDRFVEQNERTGTESLITVPLIGWVAKRRPPNGTHPYDCGFSVSKYGAQQATDWQWDPDCGNGLQPNGTPLTGNNPADTSVAVDPAFVQNWVDHLAGRFGAANAGGVRFYALDNEPMLWNSTHRDIHPQAVTYDELRDRTYAYAPALKAGDLGAQTLGPVLWGWCAYFYSAADNCAPGADYAAHGNTPFVAWYLAQMQAYETAHGTRLLDYLDLHYYPQANGVSLSSAGNAATQALRLRSTRSLWDPTYVDESWIAQAGPDGGKVQLIPRMRAWVGANYPGTRLALTEYNWGGLEHINGALAQADVLGLFGREALDLATLWAPPEADQPGAFAFRLYRNYDGGGAKFGDVSVSAASTDQAKLSVYAAQRTGDDVVTVLVVNKSGVAQTADLTLTGFTAAATAQVYRYSAANLNAIVRAADLLVDGGQVSATYPADSISLLVFTPSAGPAPLNRVHLPVVRR